ncbi:GTPase family protein [Aureliella helgolandensis]|uniref:GTPase Era n=1 Tax=Aureliella helgolandensis TaxID=2527968 RepID=A0A518G3F0_9BACT|nr:GTPase [Aureliella helgolandensis]QDV23122.1 GTPase Era [Aureliella helgolandensis]
MKFFHLLSPRLVVLSLLWALPLMCYGAIGLIALYQTGWLKLIALTLPALWALAWGVGKLWPAAKPDQAAVGKPLTAPEFWTPQDQSAIDIVEQFRRQTPAVDRVSIADYNRYLADAQTLSDKLAQHYHAEAGKNSLHPLTIIEIFAVVHLAVEDLEQWMLEHLPGSSVATLAQVERLPAILRALDLGQKFAFLSSSLLDPSRLLTYPLWRKSGRIAVKLQDELLSMFYQRYLRQVGFYLIEMYSGRLKGGSRQYRLHFGTAAAKLHAAGDANQALAELEEVHTKIAVMGQVKAGKSSLINALLQETVAETSLLPETRQVNCYQFSLPDSDKTLTLLDTPGYDEAAPPKQLLREIQTATDQADMVLLVLAANSPAREADVALLRKLQEHYRQNAQLKPPPIIAVLTHIDRLKPAREWSPPYDWRSPYSAKEESIAGAVQYNREVFGPLIVDCVPIYTGNLAESITGANEELIPVLVRHLDRGHAAAILKAYYQKLDRERFRQIYQQVWGLAKAVGRSVLKD